MENYRDMFESREQQKSYVVQEDLTQISLHGPVMWKVMERNAWSDIANWRTKQPSNCTKSQLHALMTINPKKKTWDLLENSQKSLLSNCPKMPTRHSTGSTNLHEQSPNGPELVTNAWLV